jgi:hypothetical protein
LFSNIRDRIRGGRLTISAQYFLDHCELGAYNPSHPRVVSELKPDREGDAWWKSPQEKVAEVAWIS